MLFEPATMIPKISPSSLSITHSAPLGFRVAAVKRGQATLVTATNAPSVNAGVAPSMTWTKTQPFEHGPWFRPPRTKGTIRFLGPTLDGKPAYLNFKKGQEHQTNFGQSLERVVDITDLRYFEPRATLGVEGVEWVHAPSCLSEDRLLKDEGDIETFVRGRYFDECAALVKERTGAVKAIPYNYRHRRIEQVGNLFHTNLKWQQATRLLTPDAEHQSPRPIQILRKAAAQLSHGQRRRNC